MFDFYRKSLRTKLLVIFIAIGFLPVVTLLVYTIFLSETKIVKKIVVEQHDRMKVVINLIDNHLNSLYNEVRFLSSLDLMDDILADDIDKRISRLLSQKSDDLNFNLTFILVNENGLIVASSDTSYISKSYDTSKFTKLSDTIIKKKNLYIYSSVKASFDSTKKLGYLILKYDLDNLDLYLTHKNSINSYIVNTHNNLTIGENLSFNIDFSANKNSIINEKYVVVYEKLSSILNGWYVVYGVDKNVALEFLYDFIKFMLYISFVIFIFILYASLKHSKDIVKPIKDLTEITDDITNTQNYSMRLQASSQDEIATLTHSFNEMLKTTSNALADLEEENRLRLKRFTQLIEVFNTIIQTKTENECMEVSIEEIKKLTQQQNLLFNKDKNIITNGEFTELYVTDFEHDAKIYFGTIELGIDSFEDKNEKNFYDSISSMITLQLDRIRLIQRTMSASRAKSAFISSMSHELRTPLNAIIGFSQFMIVYEELSDDQQDTVSNIESSAQYLLGMINEILDIAKIEAGKMEAHLEDVNILDIVNNSYNMLNALAKDKNLKFEFTYDDFLNKNYTTDPKMFQQIIVNLISNSIKFTEKGSIILRLSSDENNIFVSVKDTGIGIAEEDIKRLFNDFIQVENVMQKKHKGTGLGLSLCKKMAEILDGNVSLKSEGLGFGSIATLKISI